MNLTFSLVLLLPIIRRVVCVPPDDHKKGDGTKTNISQMYYSLDLAVAMSKKLVVYDKKEINGTTYTDITVRSGITVDELYHGDFEVWRAKPNRELMKVIAIENKHNTTYIVVTQDMNDKLAETYIVLSKVTMTFSPYTDAEFPPFSTSDTRGERYKNLRSVETQTSQQDKRVTKDTKTPFESKEYMSELLPGFVTKPKFREMDEEQAKKQTTI